MAEDGPLSRTPPSSFCLVPPREVPLPHRPSICVIRIGSGGLVAQSAVAPPGPIPNPVVTHRSAGEYCGVAPREARPLRAPPNRLPDDAGQMKYNRIAVTRGGAAVARWAHNPKVGGSNPPPATK